MLKKLLVPLIVLIIALPVWLIVWQSSQFNVLEQEAIRLETEQKEKIDRNKQLIAEILEYATSARIEERALELGLKKISPERVLQIKIDE
jgi:cell division protein FtsL